MPKKLKVFLCHSSDDKAAVREIYQRLKAESWIDPWLDEEELFPGQDWGLEIEKAVEETDTVLVFLSDNSVTKKGYVQKELRMVLRISDYQPDGTIFTMPLRLEKCSVPRALSMWQYVDLFPESRKNWAYGRLLGGLKLRAKKLGIEIGGAGSGEKGVREKKVSEIAVQESIEKRARELAIEMTRKEREEREKKFAEEASEKKLAKEKARQEKEARERKLAEKKARQEKEALEKKLAAAKALKEAKAKKLAANPAGIEWIKIPAGEFTMGSNDYKNEKPPHKVYLDEYFIAKMPVTNAQFKKFIEVGGYKNQEFWSDKGWEWRANKKRIQPYYWNDKKWSAPTQPVIGVTWYEAEAFSTWANCHLPSEAEWEKAARGTDERKYPWGNQEPNKNLANFDRSVGKTTPVGKYSPAGDSPYGCVDMAGNVWEWTSSLYKNYPYDATDGREDLSVAGSRALRGGSWVSYNDNLRAAYRVNSYPVITVNYIGFRCLLSLL